MVLSFVVLAIGNLMADEPASPKQPPATASEAGSAAELAHEQQQLSEKYKRFEEVLLRMAELTAPSDPKRAALLRKAVDESKHQLIGLQLDKLAEILGQDRLSIALSSGNDVQKDLTALLDLLLTEERDKSLKDERARLKEQIRRVTELINKERQLQGQTAEGGEMQGLAQGQKKVADDAGKLAKEMQSPSAGDAKEQDNGDKRDGDKSQDQDKSSEDEKSPGEGKSSAERPGQSGESQPKGDKSEKEKSEGESESKNESGEKQAGQPDKGEAPEKPAGDQQKQDGEPSSSKQGEKTRPQEGQGEGQSGQPPEGQDGESPQADQQPRDSSESARKRVQAAQEKMEAARQKLEKAQREGAVEEQEAAIRELEQAKAELEEILRQLREEELERMLAMLEGRFRKMLQAQVEVYEGTKRVDQTPAGERDRDDEIEAGRLSRKESQIVLEAESALAILREDGSAVAFPEAVEQMREDMELIVGRLVQADVGEITQGIEEDVIAALEEMIDSLQKAQQEMEKQKQQQQSQEGEQQEPPLIDSLAELKMIRSLQMRINLRTRRLARLVEGEVGQADKPELIEQLRRLAEREESVFRVTRDIVTGKNR
ncbi:MAG: hypothetical protein ABUL64_01535 [Singulisphaera sp.]